MPKAAVARGLNEPLSIEEIDLEAPRAGEVKVKMGASGVCHSDLSVINGTLFGVYPIVLGHEGAGVIEEVGDGVTDLAPGDHVVISWVPQCGQCFFCKKGQGYLCEAGAAAMATGGLLDGTTRFSKDGSPLMQMACSGTFSDTAVIPAIGAVKIPDDVPLEIAALIGCGVLTGVGAATNTADIKQGDTVVVIGCGGVGLNVIQGAIIAGAERVIAVDMLENKLKMAEQFGATDLVDASAGDALSKVMELTEQRGADVAFEVTGVQPGLDALGAVTRMSGTVAIVGYHQGSPRAIDLAHWNWMAFRVANAHFREVATIVRGMRIGMRLLTSDRIRLDDLVTHRYPLDAIDDAFRTAIEKPEGFVKATVIP